MGPLSLFYIFLKLGLDVVKLRDKISIVKGMSPKTKTGGRKMASLMNLNTNEEIRKATDAERAESVEAAKHDGGAGAIVVDGVTCYVLD